MGMEPEASRRIGQLPRGWTGHIRGDVTGGLLAAIISMPLTVGFGILAFAPLGDRYLPAGIVAGLYGAIFLGLAAIVCGARTVAVYAPRSLVAFMIASVAMHTIAVPDSPLLSGGDPSTLISALLLTLAMGGLIQFVFGLIGLGSLMKFIPSPVMAGFQNAAVILILYSQLHVMLGLPARLRPLEYRHSPGGVKPLNVALGIATVLVIWHGAKFTRRVPPAVLGLALGTAMYLALAAIGLGSDLGPVVGAMSLLMPDGMHFASIIAFATLPGFNDILPSLVSAALSVAVVASLDVLICAKIVENLSGQRTEGNSELRRIGRESADTPPGRDRWSDKHCFVGGELPRRGTDEFFCARAFPRGPRVCSPLAAAGRGGCHPYGCGDSAV